MIAACPMCAARYRIDPGRLRPEGARLRCSRCETVFRVVPPRGEGDLPAAAPARPAPPAPPAPPEPARPAAAPAPAQAARPAPAEVVRPAPAPPAAPAPPRPTPPAAAAPPRPAEPAPAREPAATPAPPPPAADPRRARLVLVADPDTESGKRTAGVLSEWGLEPLLVHDGVEAILTIQRSLPRAVVLDAALPKMFGFQVCELVKRNESLREIRVVLVGAIHHRERYRRPPSELYGADVYVERPDLPGALREHLARFGLSLAPAPLPAPRVPAEAKAAPPPRPAATAEPPTAELRLPSLAPAAPAPARAPLESPRPAAAALPARLAEEVAKAERLARIIVSDIALYNPEKFEAALAGGNVLEAMESELEEGRALLTQRVSSEVRAARDFLRDELLRVARMRSGR